MGSDSSRHTVVTGMGSISAVGKDCTTAIHNIQGGKVESKIIRDTHFPPPFVAPCFVLPGDPLAALQYRVSQSNIILPELNRTLILALTAIYEALDRAALTVAELQKKRVGIALGTTVGCTFHHEKYYIDWKEGAVPDPRTLDHYFAANLSECIQKILGLQGPRVVITNACASGTDAIGLATDWLEYGGCDIAIAGGADELSRIACHGFKSLMLVSKHHCRPFDQDRQGLNLGEGAGILILEKEKQAIASKRPILGKIRGYGIAGDAHHPTAPHPHGHGLQQAVGKALAAAEVKPQEVSMINAHGTGTKANDKAESQAIYEMGFPTTLPVVSTKGVTGHTLGAAGGIEAVFTLLTLNQGELRGTIGCEQVDKELAFPILAQGEHASLTGRIGISQSLAFGGSNSALVIEGTGR